MIDANVLVAGNAFPRWPYEVLRHALAGDYELYLCPYVVEEARRTMSRVLPEDAHRLEKFLELCPYYEVPDPSSKRVLSNLQLVRSHKDVPAVLAARVAKVHYLVTNDRDLTIQDATAVRIRHWFSPVLPAVFLREIMNSTSEQLEAIRHRTWKDLNEIPTPNPWSSAPM